MRLQPTFYSETMCYTMKKLLLGVTAILLMASCSRKDTTEKANDDSIRIADSITQVEAIQAAVEQARLDSIRQDSIQKETEKAEFAEIQSLVKNFYQTSVIGCNKKNSKSHLSKYLTDKLISQLIRENEFDDGGVAVWNLRGDPQDCDNRDKVLSVEKSNGNSVIVTFLDCGYTCKVRLDLVKENSTWKIDNYKFISQSSKSKYNEFNW